MGHDPQSIYIGLVHHPVLNKRGMEVTTSVTNLDVHDIARTSRTFGMAGYFIITPIKAQHELLSKILNHWQEDEANEYNPDRHDALSYIQVTESVDQAVNCIIKKHAEQPLVAVTGARFNDYEGDTSDLMSKIKLDNRPMLLLFGTGWGLSASVVDRADFRLRPINGAAVDHYNHLSVRSAVAIYCDRLRRKPLVPRD